MARRVWQCAHALAMDRPRSRQSDQLRAEATRDTTIGVNFELWAQGLLPSARYEVPQPPAWGDRQIPLDLNCGGPELMPDLPVPIDQRIDCMLAFLGGSASSIDARMARAGWGAYFA